MSKDSGYLVETKTGKNGRTYHRENLIDKKIIVHVIDDNNLKILCDPQTIKITGYID